MLNNRDRKHYSSSVQTIHFIDLLMQRIEDGYFIFLFPINLDKPLYVFECSTVFPLGISVLVTITVMSILIRTNYYIDLIHVCTAIQKIESNP